MAVVRILGIDPGTQVVGFGCLEFGEPDARSSRSRRPMGSSSAADSVREAVESGDFPTPVPLALRGSNVVRSADSGSAGVRLVRAGVLRLGARGAPLTMRLLALQQQFDAIVRELRPNELAIEEAFFGKSVQAALRIGEARGVVLAGAASVGVDVHQYAPARVKRCVAGHGAARKQTVAKMLQQLLPAAAGLDPTLPLDASDALAVAWTRLEERRSPLLAAGSAKGPARRSGASPKRG